MTMATAAIVLVLNHSDGCVFARRREGGMLTPALATGARGGTLLVLIIKRWQELISCSSSLNGRRGRRVGHHSRAPFWAAIFVGSRSAALWLLWFSSSPP